MPEQSYQKLAMEMIGYGVAKAGEVPPEERFHAALLGGLIAGFTRSPEVADTKQLLNAISRETHEGSMISDEALEVFKSVVDANNDGSCFKSSEPLEELVFLIAEHPEVQNPRNLVRLMPSRAIPLVSALGVLVASTIQRLLPELADRIRASAGQ